MGRSGLEELEFRFVRLPDENGTEVIASNASSVVSKIISHWRRRGSKTQADRRMLDLVERSLQDLANSESEDVTPLTLKDMAGHAGSAPMWMFRLRDIEKATTKSLDRVRDALLQDMPEDDGRKEWVTDLYDEIVSRVTLFGMEEVAKAEVLDEAAFSELGITDDVLYTRVLLDPQDKKNLHQTMTYAVRQGLGHTMLEASTGARWEIGKEHTKRLDLFFKDDREEYSLIADLVDEVENISHAMTNFKMCRLNRLNARRQLSQFAERVGLFDELSSLPPASVVHLGQYAPSSKAWQAGVQSLASEEPPTLTSIIKGWPLGKQYIEKFGDDQPKKKRRRPKKKGKGGSTSVPQPDQSEVQSEITQGTSAIFEEVDDLDTAKEGSVQPSISSSKPPQAVRPQARKKQRHYPYGDFSKLILQEPVSNVDTMGQADKSRSWLPTDQTLQEMQLEYLRGFKDFKTQSKSRGKKKKARSAAHTSTSVSHSISRGQTTSAIVTEETQGGVAEVEVDIDALDLAMETARLTDDSGRHDPALREMLEKYKTEVESTVPDTHIEIEDLVEDMGGWSKVTQAWRETQQEPIERDD